MITSVTNPQVKNLIRLREKSKERKKQGVFVAEGLRMCMEAPKELLVKLFLSESFYARGAVCRDVVRDREYEVLADDVFRRVSDTQTPQGVLAVIKQPAWRQEEILRAENGLWLVLEDIRDPGNLGTIFRTAEAAGAGAIIMSGGTVDVYNPKVVRSTMGSLFRMPFFYSQDIVGTVLALKDSGARVFAAHLEGRSFYDEESYLDRTAFLIGNEGDGLSPELLSQAHERIKIPMCGAVESLNASVASALLLYEANRQRRKRK